MNQALQSSFSSHFSPPSSSSLYPSYRSIDGENQRTSELKNSCYSLEQSFVNYAESFAMVNSSSSEKIGYSSTLLPFQFKSSSINDIKLGVNQYNRSKQNIFLKRVELTMNVTCEGDNNNNLLRFGIFYDKNCSKKSLYSSEDLFNNLASSVPGSSSLVDGPYLRSNSLSCRNIDYLDRYILVYDDYICFGRNYLLDESETESKITLLQSQPGNFYMTKSINLHPLVTMFDVNSEEGTETEKINGNLCIFFFPFVKNKEEKDTRDVILRITYNARLYFTCHKDYLSITNPSSYLVDPDLYRSLEINKNLIAGKYTKEQKNMALKKIQSIHNKNLFSDFNYVNKSSRVYMILNSASKIHPSFSISNSISNGFSYLKTREISELKYVDFYAIKQKIAYCSELDKDKLNPKGVYLINTVDTGTGVNKRTNSRIKLVEIQFRLFVETDFNYFKENDITVDDSLSLNPLLFNFAIVYDKSANIGYNKDFTVFDNYPPSIYELFSEVTPSGTLQNSLFKTVQSTDRYLILCQKQYFLDTRDPANNIFLSLSCNFDFDIIKLFHRTKDMSLASLVIKEKGNGINNTRDAFRSVASVLDTKFNPTPGGDGEEKKVITSGAVYAVLFTQNLSEEQLTQLNHQLISFQTRVFFID